MRSPARILIDPTLWLIATGTLGWFSKTAYRHMVSSTGFNDLGLHGVLPNFFWAAFLALLGARFSSSVTGACLAAFAANAVYEFDQLLSSTRRTFDPWDIVAAAIGCFLAYLILRANPEQSGDDA